MSSSIFTNSAPAGHGATLNLDCDVLMTDSFEQSVEMPTGFQGASKEERRRLVLHYSENPAPKNNNFDMGLMERTLDLLEAAKSIFSDEALATLTIADVVAIADQTDPRHGIPPRDNVAIPGKPVFFPPAEAPMQHVNPAELSTWGPLSGAATATAPRSIHELNGMAVSNPAIEQAESAKAHYQAGLVFGRTSPPRQSLKTQRATFHGSPEQISKLRAALASPPSSPSPKAKRAAPRKRLATPRKIRSSLSNAAMSQAGPSTPPPRPLNAAKALLSSRTPPKRAAAIRATLAITTKPKTPSPLSPRKR